MQKKKYVGIDLSKREMVVDLCAPRGANTLANDAAGQAALLGALPAGAHVVCESTGGYQRELVKALHAAGVPVTVVQPRRVRALATSQGLRAKTDRIDARLLTQFGEAMQPKSTPPPSAAQAELQELMRARQQLIEQMNDEASHADHCTLPLLQAQAEARRTLRKAQLREIEQRLRTLIRADAHAQWRSERVQQVCGIGEVSAWTVLAMLPELGHMQRGQPGALLGTAPDPNDSGPRKGQRHISGGRASARKILYMAALTASQRNPILSAFYRRLVEQRHKPKLVALTAVMRKLVELLNRLLADPEFKLAT
jgi:transposase